MTGLSKLAQFGDVSTSIKGQVCSYFNDREWNIRKLSQVQPNKVVSQIFKITIKFPDLVDRPIWTARTDRKFSCKSAWNCIRTYQNTSLVNKMIWHKKSLFKISFFLWRLFRHKIAVDTNMRMFGIPLPSMSSCCTNNKQEDEEHLFLNSMISHNTWKHFNQQFGISQRSSSLRHHIISWWMTEGSNPIQELCL